LINPLKLAELDAHHVLRALAHEALISRRLDVTRDEIRGLRGVLLVGNPMNCEKLERLIAQAVVLAQSSGSPSDAESRAG